METDRLAFEERLSTLADDGARARREASELGAEVETLKVQVFQEWFAREENYV